MRRILVAAFVAACPLVLAAFLVACGSETGARDPARSGSTPSPRGMPTEVPAAPGPVTTGYPAIVLDGGDGVVLCVGPVATSMPPQCGGPRLAGWDWSDHAGDFEQVGGVRWGSFAVTGTFDGRTLTPTEVVPADEFGEGPPTTDGRDLTSPCPEPEGGWAVLDAERTTDRTLDQTIRAAQRLDGFAELWLDQSINPLYGRQGPEAEVGMNDPRRLVLNVRVTGDVEAAEQRLRETWGGALCVSRGRHTDAELERIQTAMANLPGMLTTSRGDDRVDVEVTYDDGSIQAWADEQYGEGTVRVTSALVAAR